MAVPSESQARSTLPQIVGRLVDRQRLLPAGPAVIAFSGGPDSLCLLHLMADLAAERGWQLLAAHCDHGLRPESAAEVQLIRQLAATRDIPLITARVDVLSLAWARQWSVETAARVARYRFLASVAAQYGAPVVTGHHQDDQAETLLLRLERGTGLTGLQSMRPTTALPPSAWAGPANAPAVLIVRPLLTIGRPQILAELARRRLIPLLDQTNQDPLYARNRLRRNLLAVWETSEPGIGQRLARTADLLAADEDFLAAETERAWAALEPQLGPEPSIAFGRAAFLAHPLALQRRLVRLALSRLGAGGTAAAVETARTHALERVGSHVTLTSTVGLTVWPLSLWFGPPGVQPPPPFPWMTAHSTCAPALPGTTVLPGAAWTLTCRSIAPEHCQMPLSGSHVHLLPEVAQQELQLRPWQQGDRIKLAGRAGHKKVSDVFIDRKVPRAGRAVVPILTAGSTIAWIVGHMVSGHHRAAHDAPLVLCCTTQQSPSDSQPTD